MHPSSFIGETVYLVPPSPPCLLLDACGSVVSCPVCVWPCPPIRNIPYFPDIFAVSGCQELVDQYGPWFAYDTHPRALIFQRNHSDVTDLSAMQALMR